MKRLDIQTAAGDGVQPGHAAARRPILRGRLGTALRRHGTAICAITVLTLYLYGALLSSVFTITHESYSVYIRVHQYLEEMRAGYWQPLSLQDCLRGAGFAFPVFYPPLGYLVAAIMAGICGNVIMGAHLSLFLSVLASAFAAYACAVVLSRRPAIGLASSALYVTVTYRFVDAYVRGAIAECWVFAWCPLIVLGAYQACTGRRGAWILPVAVACLITSHSVLALYFVAMLAPIVLCMVAATCRWRAILRLAALFVIGIGLSCWFVVPQQIWLKTVWASDAGFMWSSPEAILVHSLDFAQLFKADPQAWFGNSLPGIGDEMSFKLGLGHALALATLLMALCHWRRLRCANSSMHMVLALGCFVAWTVGILFMLMPLPFIKVLPPQFGYLQFVWRMLSLLPVFALVFFCITARAFARPRWHAPAFVLVALVLAAEVPDFYMARRLKHDVSAGDIMDERSRGNADMGATELAEYLPRTFPLDRRGKNFVTQPVGQQSRCVATTRKHRGLYEFTFYAPLGDTVTLPLIAYPFWTVTTADARVCPIRDNHGYMQVAIPAGPSVTITVRRHYTKAHYTGWLLTGLSAAMLVGYSWVSGRQRAKLPAAATTASR